jgi:hypothetical protein
LAKRSRELSTRHTKKAKKQKKIDNQALGQALMGTFDTANILTKKKIRRLAKR